MEHTRIAPNARPLIDFRISGTTPFANHADGSNHLEYAHALLFVLINCDDLTRNPPLILSQALDGIADLIALAVYEREASNGK